MRDQHTPLECLAPPLLETLPQQCQQLKRGFRECKRGMVDMRKRFRGNMPISTALEVGGEGGAVSGDAQGEGAKKGGQLYGGKPVFGALDNLSKQQRGEVEGLGFDESKTRGL